MFAEYWDDVPDQTLISNSSRFVAGGIGGVVSQFGMSFVSCLTRGGDGAFGGVYSGGGGELICIFFFFGVIVV